MDAAALLLLGSYRLSVVMKRINEIARLHAVLLGRGVVAETVAVESQPARQLLVYSGTHVSDPTPPARL